MFVQMSRPLGVFLLLMMALGAGCGRVLSQPDATDAPPPALPPVSSEQMQAFTLVSDAEDGRRRWQVSGKSANLMTELIELSDITATAYGQDTRVTLTARGGLLDRRRHDVQLAEDVQAVTTEGTTLTTQSLAWNAERQTLTTADWVTVARDNLMIVGRGAVGSPGLRRVRFQREVHVTLNPSTVITCRGPLEIDYARHRARFRRHVAVQDPRGEIWADRMDVRIDPTTHQLTQVQCWGHVRIVRERQTAQSHRALYRQPDGTILMIGHPQVTCYPESISREPFERPAAP